MSSRNAASKRSHHDSKSNSGSRRALASRKQKNSSDSQASPSNNTFKQSSFSANLADSASQASSPRAPSPNNATPMLESTSDKYQVLATAMHNQVAYTNVDLLEVSAWTHQSQSQHHYQDFSYQHRDTMQTSTCPYHVSEMSSDYHTAWSGYGLAPLGRWLDEHVGDGGALALQLGYQLREDCTCLTMQDGVDMATADRFRTE